MSFFALNVSSNDILVSHETVVSEFQYAEGRLHATQVTMTVRSLFCVVCVQYPSHSLLLLLLLLKELAPFLHADLHMKATAEESREVRPGMTIGAYCYHDQRSGIARRTPYRWC